MRGTWTEANSAIFCKLSPRAKDLKLRFDDLSVNSKGTTMTRVRGISSWNSVRTSSAREAWAEAESMRAVRPLTESHSSRIQCTAHSSSSLYTCAIIMQIIGECIDFHATLIVRQFDRNRATGVD